MGRIQSHKDKPTMQTRLAIGPPRACAVPYSGVVYTVTTATTKIMMQNTY